MRRPVVLALVSLALPLTACGGGGSASTAPSEGQSPEPGADSPADTDGGTPDEIVTAIREFDFTTVEWREQVSQTYLMPVSDPADADPAAGPIVTAGEAAYADVDRDGYEDALVPLVIQDGNSRSQIYYIWTWDTEAQAPVQVENPIARAHDCGALVDEVAADQDANAFVIVERLRQPGAEGACADQPTLKVKRSVTLSDGWPVLTTGLGGHGGICPQPRGHDGTWPVEDTTLLAGPRERIGTVEDPQLSWFAEADVSGYQWLFREGWLLVNFGPLAGQGRDSHFTEYGDYTPCAWVQVDPARQSEFGMLPPEQG